MAITPAELIERIDRGAAPAILDVRSKAEYDEGHVPGAVHVPFWQVAASASALPADRAASLVVYCGHGPRAWMAGAALRRLGFTRIEYLSGHMTRWRREGRREAR